MKKSKGSRPQIGKQAYQIAKSLSTDGIRPKPGGELSQTNISPDLVLLQESMRKFEAEVMGEQGQGSKSDIKARNLEQMVAVLHQRLGALETAAKTRMYLCTEDMNANSTNNSKQAPKISDEFDEVNIQKVPRDIKFTSSHRDNLVSSENIFVDATHLVVKTKAVTDTGKKLEIHLEESFGATSLRELKGKKANKSRSDKTKKSVQQKTEAKKQIRTKLEKDLHTNMENYVTRSVNDAELKFHAPIDLDDEPVWPITIKWPSANLKSKQPENSDGEMDPGLLLRYSVEKINIPSGENMFRWLVKQDMIQEYFVNMFWLIKIKFFQTDSSNYDETFLLKRLSAQYVRIVEMLAKRAHAEHEKDFAFKYIPYIISNAVYCSFYFLCPGSRHIYTKSFRKTVLMQVVKIMHGVQLHPLTIKVTWAKLFPEEVQEGEEDGEEGGEIFPVQLAFSKKSRELRPRSAPDAAAAVVAGAVTSLSVDAASVVGPSVGPGLGGTGTVTGTGGTFGVPGSAGGAQTQRHGGVFAGDVMGEGDATGLVPGSSTARVDQTSSSACVSPSPSKPETLATPMGGAYTLGPDDPFYSHAPTEDELRRAAQLSRLPPTKPVLATLLKPPMERPKMMMSTVLRQNKETADALELSPQLQEFLVSTTHGLRATQPIARTMPISWCVAGGSDTHHRRQVPKELHDELSGRAGKTVKEFRRENMQSRVRAIKIVQQVERSCSAVLGSGQQSISRMSLDLVKQQKRVSKPGAKGDATAAAGLDEAGLSSADAIAANLEKYANYQDEDLEEFLAQI